MVAGYADLVEVGRGGYSVVYRAWEEAFERTVALKVMNQWADEGTKRRFAREQAAVGRLSDIPGVLTVYSQGLTLLGQPYIAMPYLASGSLANRISTGGPLSWTDAARLMAAVAHTIAEVSDRGVIHGDLKPHNILLDGRDQPQLVDFGIARLIGTAITSASYTPAYAAPEVFDEQATPTTATDVWGLGVCAAALMLGHSPFSEEGADGPLPLMNRILNGEPILPTVCPAAVQALLAETMSKVPGGRPTATDFAERLERSLRNHDATTHQSGPPSRRPSATAEAGPPGPVVSIVELGRLGSQLGSGRHGTVWALPRPYDQLVLKRYEPPHRADDTALDNLIAWRQSLSVTDLELLDRCTAWPRARVTDGQMTVGVVLPRAPDRFDARDQRAGSLRDIGDLYLSSEPADPTAPVPEPIDRLRIVIDLARALGFLGRHGVAHGGISEPNVLWAPPAAGSPSIYLVGCDEASVGGSPSPLPRSSVPGWVDPRLTKGETETHDQASDLYALTLAFIRCYYGRAAELDEGSTSINIPVWPPAGAELLRLVGRGLSHTADRPTATTWLRALEDLHTDLQDPTTGLGRLYRSSRGELPAGDHTVAQHGPPTVRPGDPPAQGARPANSAPADTDRDPLPGTTAPSREPVGALTAALSGAAIGSLLAVVIIVFLLS